MPNMGNLRANGEPKMKTRAVFAAYLLASTSLLLSAPAAAKTKPAKPADEKAATSTFTGMEYRQLGPFRGGRATGVAGVPGDPTT